MAQQPVGDAVGRLAMASEQLFQGRTITTSRADNQKVVRLGRPGCRDGSHDAAYTPLVQTSEGDILLALILSESRRQMRARNFHDFTLSLPAGTDAGDLGRPAGIAAERLSPTRRTSLVDRFGEFHAGRR